jgi:hypothetical protein
MNDNDRAPTVEFTILGEPTPEELDFMIKKRDAIIQMCKENNGQIPKNIDERLQALGLLTF